MIRIATPILFAAMGELVAERSGVMNMGLEGTMLTAAFIGFMVAEKTGSLAIGNHHRQPFRCSHELDPGSHDHHPWC